MLLDMFCFVFSGSIVLRTIKYNPNPNRLASGNEVYFTLPTSNRQIDRYIVECLFVRVPRSNDWRCQY